MAAGSIERQAAEEVGGYPTSLLICFMSEINNIGESFMCRVVYVHIASAVSRD